MEAGPRSEVTYWRGRVGVLSSLADSLKRREYAAVAGVAAAARTKEHKQWKAVEAKVRCLHIPLSALGML